MFEKVNPAHPDKLADRIAGAIVDEAYKRDDNPKIAVEVLMGHGICHIIAETSVHIQKYVVEEIVHRITGTDIFADYMEVPQDVNLARNQEDALRCGDNGIFRGMPVTDEQKSLCEVADFIYGVYPYDGKYIMDEARLIICQSNADSQHLREVFPNSRSILWAIGQAARMLTAVPPTGSWAATWLIP